MDPDVPAGPPQTIADDRPCLACGYNLRGLLPTDNCPECGRAVALSLRGNLLRYSNPDYAANLHRGVFLIQAAIIAQFLLMLAVFVGIGLLSAAGSRPTGLNWVIGAVGAATSIGAVVGWWLLSSPDPAYVGADDGTTARKVVRVAVAISAAATLVSLLVGEPNTAALVRGAALRGSDAILVAVKAASKLAWVVWFFAAMRYLQWLAPRLPDPRVGQRAKRLTWIGPLLYLFLCVLGWLVALILYYNLLEWVRKDLKAIRAEQAAGGATA